MRIMRRLKLAAVTVLAGAVLLCCEAQPVYAASAAQPVPAQAAKGVRGYQIAEIQSPQRGQGKQFTDAMPLAAIREAFPDALNLAVRNEPLSESVLRDITGENAASSGYIGSLSVLMEWENEIVVVIGVGADGNVSLLSSGRTEYKIPKARFFAEISRYAVCGGVCLPVENVSQLSTGLVYGCEFTAMYQITRYAVGNSAPDIHSFVRGMQYSTDGTPYTGYVGNPYTTNAWTTAPGPQLAALRGYIGSSVDLSGASVSKIRAYLTAGVPVAVWFSGFQAAGEGYRADTMYTHCCLLTGYDSYGFYLNDPYQWDAKAGEGVWYPAATVNRWMRSWGYWALSY